MWSAVFVSLMIWKSVTGLQEEKLRDPRSRTEAASRRTSGLVARVGRVTLWAEYCGFALLGLLLIGAIVWVDRGIIAFNAGLPP